MIEIGPHQFPTRDATKAYIRAILARYAPGDLVEGEDHHTLMELTLRHPRADEKVGAGIDRFRVVLGLCGRSRAFEILRTDGTGTDISFPKCVDGDPPHRTLVLRSLRLVVEPDVNALRQRLFRELIGPDGRLLPVLSIWSKRSSAEGINPKFSIALARDQLDIMWTWSPKLIFLTR